MTKTMKSQVHGPKIAIRKYYGGFKSLLPLSITAKLITANHSGCACDIPSVTYQFPWELKIWSKFYAEAAEIQGYMKHVADKYGLRKFIKLQHEVIHAEWDDGSAKWHVKVRNLTDGTKFVDTSDVLINASGTFK